MKNLSRLFLPLFFLPLFFFNSCTPMVKLIYGVTKPKVEDEASLTRYLKNKKIPFENVYTVGFEDFKPTLAQTGNAVPEARLFNKKGDFIPYKDGDQCNAVAFTFIENLKAEKPDSVSFIGGSMTGLFDIGQGNINNSYAGQVEKGAALTETVKPLRDLKGNPVDLKLEEDYDYYLFLYWTKYTGRLNKDHILVWENQALNNKNAKIKVIKVNLDYQEFWGAENLKKIMRKE